MNKTLFTTVSLSLILIPAISVFGAYPVLADSNMPMSFSSGVTIYSPVNTTYASRFLTLNLTFGFGLGVQTTINYTLDGKDGGPINFEFQNPTEMHIINPATGMVQLPELSEGSHCLSINILSGITYHGGNPPGAPFKPSAAGSSDYIASWIHTVYFTINSSMTPSPSPTPQNAESASTILIGPDGSVIGTNKIQVSGKVYTLEDNLYATPIVVECNNIVLDGKGFTLQGAGGWPTPAAINLTCTNVTVQNFNILNWEVGILGAWNNNTIRSNNLTNNERNIAIYADNYNVSGNQILNGDYSIRIIGNNNTIQNNYIKAGAIAFWITSSSGNLITKNEISFQNPILFQTDTGGFKVYHNNFISTRNVTGFLLNMYGLTNTTASIPPMWDNGFPSGGNYWSDYTARYPNASEIDNSGIGNTPYLINVGPNVIDRYPLLIPVNISLVPAVSPLPTPSFSTTTPNPTQSPNISPTLTPSPPIAELSCYAVVILLIFAPSIILVYGKRKVKTH